MNKGNQKEEADDRQGGGGIEEADGSGDIARLGVPVPGTKAVVTEFLNLDL